MAKKSNGAAALENRLLARLPDREKRRFLALAEPVTLEMKQVLYEQRGLIDYAYFPTGAVCSALTIMQDGSAIEVATVGKEGILGHSVASGGRRSPNKVIVQIPDGGLRIEADVLRDEVASNRPLTELLANYHEAFMAQVSQSVACNGLHRLEQRCCRWLLMTRDRVGSDALRLTHEFLGIMLGARRASVTDVLRPLQDDGLIRSHRGTISILNGAGVETRSCECYRVVKEEYDRLLGRR